RGFVSWQDHVSSVLQPAASPTLPPRSPASRAARARECPGSGVSRSQAPPPRPTSALAREIVPNPPSYSRSAPSPHIPTLPLTSNACRRGGSSILKGKMSRRGKSVPQLGGGPAKRGGGTPPAAPSQSELLPPPPNGSWFPGYGGSSGQSSSFPGIQSAKSMYI
ncbi:hypothetical protein PVAP13_2NG318303, partial [Panicum virgatum]